MKEKLSKFISRFRKKQPEPERFSPSPEQGLTSDQAERRTAAGLVNSAGESASKTTWQIVRSNIFTYFNLIFFVLAAVLLYERSYNNLTFLAVIVANTVIGIVQELNAKRELEKLQLVTSPEAVVIRDGTVRKIPTEELVLDDIVALSAGSQICADAVVVAGSLSVNEALVTGEADEVKKDVGDALLSGSFVVSGTARARLERVGEASFAQKLSKDAKKIKKKQQPGMMKSLTRLIQVIGIIIIPFAALMFYNQHIVLGLSEKVSVENSAASVIGMIPEGLYLLTSIALAASTVRLAKGNTLVHDMKCIETLARVDIICVDKTGTITEPNMRLNEIIPLDSANAEDALRDFALSMDADNETIKALKAHFSGAQGARKASRTRGFSSATKYSAADFGGDAYVLGAPEFVLKSPDAALSEKISSLAGSGERVLLFARYTYEKGSADDIFKNGRLGENVSPLALVTLRNPVRATAKQTFAYFAEQGVSVRVISGDNPATASAAALEAGIPGAEKYIDLSTLSDNKAVMKAATEYTVFGRVTPEQKRLLIRAMKKGGHTVAMTGDGVNDVLALKDADCSVAMASGADAAANVSDLVLLDSDFSNMPRVVAEGRRVINNIERSASLFLVKNIFSFILSLISLISVSLYPLTPSQISLVSALMIGAPSFVLAFEPNEELVRGKFLRNVLRRAAPSALTAVVLVEWSLLFADAFSLSHELASTVAFFLFAFAAYVMLFRVCRPMTLLHGALFALMGIGFIAASVLLPEWFGIAQLDYGSVMILSALLALAVPIEWLFQRAFSGAEALAARISAAVSRLFSKLNRKKAKQAA